MKEIRKRRVAIGKRFWDELYERALESKVPYGASMDEGATRKLIWDLFEDESDRLVATYYVIMVNMMQVHIGLSRVVDIEYQLYLTAQATNKVLRGLAWRSSKAYWVRRLVSGILEEIDLKVKADRSLRKREELKSDICYLIGECIEYLTNREILSRVSATLEGYYAGVGIPA